LDIEAGTHDAIAAPAANLKEVQMAKSFYTVSFLTASGWQVAQTCATIRIARKRAKWYADTSWVQAVVIHRGAPGGEVVE
jgi:hypothetical protein